MKRTVLALASTLLFVAFSAQAHAALGEDAENFAPISIDKTPTKEALEGKLQRALTEEELQGLGSFLEKAALIEPDLSPRGAALNGSTDITTLLFCVGVKGGIVVIKGVGSVCVDTSAKTYIIAGSGVGVVVGFAVTGSVFVHKGPAGSIFGTYHGVGGSASISDALTLGLKGFLGAIGGEIHYLRTEQAALYGAGLMLGKFADFTGTQLNILPTDF